MCVFLAKSRTRLMSMSIAYRIAARQVRYMGRFELQRHIGRARIKDRHISDDVWRWPRILQRMTLCILYLTIMALAHILLFIDAICIFRNNLACLLLGVAHNVLCSSIWQFAMVLCISSFTHCDYCYCSLCLWWVAMCV